MSELVGRLKSISPGWRAVIFWLITLILVIAITLTIRAYAVQAFYIKSSSMEPTLQASDRVFVNKLSYSAHKINRGDVVIIDKNKALVNSGGGQEPVDLIKRVIGLEGETILIQNCQVFVNDLLLEEPYVKNIDPKTDICCPRIFNPVRQEPEPPIVCEWKVPDSHVFVLGDNRLGSIDSRLFGPIPENSIVGRAFIKVWPFWNFSIL